MTRTRTSYDTPIELLPTSRSSWKVLYLLHYCTLILVLTVTEVGFEIHGRSSNPIMCQITDDGLRQVVYIVP